ncbi:MAG TPA: prepilin peptidase [Candidatus Binataceae bacterium]|nr:prepilin peptidase [Candidatus Binataceae bacterium]
MLALFAFIFGACIGSFVNVVAYRLPRELSIVRPRSFCPRCSRPIPFWANVPILGWLLLRGHCLKCRERISFRYFVVELLIALESLYLLINFPLIDATTRLFLCAALAVVALIDYDWRVIPNLITLGGIPLGVIAATLAIPEVGWLSSLIGLAAGAGFLFLTGEVYFRLRGQEGVGLGDVYLVGMVGAFLGWQGVIFTLFAGSMLGGIGGIVFALTGVAQAPPEDEIPIAIHEVTSVRRGDAPPPYAEQSIFRTEVAFGPFLAAAASLYALFQPLLIRYYLP